MILLIVISIRSRLILTDSQSHQGTAACRTDHGFLCLSPNSQRAAAAPLSRSLAPRNTRGFVKLVADSNTRKMVGAHISASEAGEMITELAIAVQFGLTIEQPTSVFHANLTLSKGVKLAALTFDKDVARLSCCAV